MHFNKERREGVKHTLCGAQSINLRFVTNCMTYRQVSFISRAKRAYFTEQRISCVGDGWNPLCPSGMHAYIHNSFINLSTKAANCVGESVGHFHSLHSVG